MVDRGKLCEPLDEPPFRKRSRFLGCFIAPKGLKNLDDMSRQQTALAVKLSALTAVTKPEPAVTGYTAS